MLVVAGRVLPGGGGRRGCGGWCCVHHGNGLGDVLHPQARVAADAYGFLAFRYLEFRDTGLLEQLDQLLYLANIHPRTPFDYRFKLWVRRALAAWSASSYPIEPKPNMQPTAISEK